MRDNVRWWTARHPRTRPPWLGRARHSPDDRTQPIDEASRPSILFVDADLRSRKNRLEEVKARAAVTATTSRPCKPSRTLSGTEAPGT